MGVFYHNSRSDPTTYYFSPSVLNICDPDISSEFSFLVPCPIKKALCSVMGTLLLLDILIFCVTPQFWWMPLSALRQILEVHSCTLWIFAISFPPDLHWLFPTYWGKFISLNLAVWSSSWFWAFASRILFMLSLSFAVPTHLQSAAPPSEMKVCRAMQATPGGSTFRNIPTQRNGESVA